MYAWSGNRATVHTPNPIELYFSGDFFNTYADPKIVHPIFSNSRRAFLQKSDSIIRFAKDSVGKMQINSAASNIYNINNDLLEHNQIITTGNLFLTEFTYNSSGDVVLIKIYKETNTSQLGNFTHFSSVYSFYNNDKLVNDSVVYHIGTHETQVYDYYADASGKDTAIWMHFYQPWSGVYLQNIRYTFDYDPLGRLQSIKLYDYHHTSGQNIARLDSIQYTGANTFPSFYGFYNFDLQNPQKITSGVKSYYTLNANGDIQNELMTEYNLLTTSWDSIYSYDVIYNNFFNPEYILYDEYDGTSWVKNAYRFNFHYTAFTNVSEAKKQAINLVLYPNPSNGLVHLTTNNNEAATISVTDMQGRLLQRYRTHKNSDITLNLTNLPAATYLITFETATLKGSEIIHKQ